MGINALLSFVPLISLIVLVIIPFAKILKRTGHSPFWALLAIIPVVNIIAYWKFAFKRWPSDSTMRNESPSLIEKKSKSAALTKPQRVALSIAFIWIVAVLGHGLIFLNYGYYGNSNFLNTLKLAIAPAAFGLFCFWLLRRTILKNN